MKIFQFLFLASVAFLTTQDVSATDITWKLDAVSSLWTDFNNWVPSEVPGLDDRAIFGVSNITTINSPGTLSVGGVVFRPEASAYTIAPNREISMSFYGDVINKSAFTQHFTLVTEHAFSFHDSANAGSNVLFTCPTICGVNFFENSKAGTAAFDCGAFAGVSFYNDANADHAVVNLNAAGAHVRFFGNSSGGRADVIAAASGSVLFFDDSDGDEVRIQISGSAILTLYYRNLPGTRIGSLEGDGIVSLGSAGGGRNLTIGKNNLSTTFSGIIDDDGLGGSITKIGTGTLVLTAANTYTGDTIVKHGILVVDNTVGSATGTGRVRAEGATLAGTGVITGAVTIGRGIGGRKSYLSPGDPNEVGTLTTESLLTFNPSGSYNYDFDSDAALADDVLADGVTIDPGAEFTLNDRGAGVLPQGIVLTAISNTSANPISGIFSNLPDGAIVNVNGNNLQASYSGGDGNDLTLTVVP